MYSQGWLFDVYPAQTTMVVWLYQEDGQLLRLEDPFRPRLYARGRPDDLQALARATLRTRVCSRCTLTRQREFWSGELVTVLALEVADYGMFPRLLQRLSEFESRITFYNCDLPLPQYYLYCREIFPFGQCEVEHAGCTIARIRACEPSTALHYAMPSLRILELQLTQDPLIPLQRGNTLQVTLDGRSYEYTTNDSAELLDQLNTCLIRYDPDLILTDYGDTAIFPALLHLARRHRMPLALDREPTPIERRLVTEGRSFFTYGKMLYYPPAYALYGRWHIDRAHSFLHHETGFSGIVEVARLAKLPVQRAARASIGTILTSMQLDLAVQRGVLIPWRKGEPERWKTADVLLRVDKGGLVFQPPVGAFEDVAELDFSAMYPTIMVQHNISAETLFCRCCDNQVVPEAGYTICERHEGLAAAMLKPLIKRRAYYKARVKAGGIAAEEAALYDQRQRAHKWIGVTCFGYLGYRNARFGRIESHEAVTAFGREKLLQAKEICEAHGYELLHALTDSLWIRQPGLTDEALLALCDEITDATGITMSLEGRYRWMIFLPSKVRSQLSAANRYFGVFWDGTLKARGLAHRRHDVPVFIQATQLAMLEILAEAADLAGYAARIPQALAALRDTWEQLAIGHVPPLQLLVSKTVGQELEAYRVENATVQALRQLRAVGIHLHPGERVRYLIRDARAPNKDERVRAFPRLGPEDGFDVVQYQAMLLDAALELLVPFGYDAARVRRIMA
ncbi:MAG: DNA polymerase domain-containing protein [Candidatus Entotheonellia bacterium]